jgi:hypothetical protein
LGVPQSVLKNGIPREKHGGVDEVHRAGGLQDESFAGVFPFFIFRGVDPDAVDEIRRNVTGCADPSRVEEGRGDNIEGTGGIEAGVPEDAKLASIESKELGVLDDETPSAGDDAIRRNPRRVFKGFSRSGLGGDVRPTVPPQDQRPIGTDLSFEDRASAVTDVLHLSSFEVLQCQGTVSKHVCDMMEFLYLQILDRHADRCVILVRSSDRDKPGGFRKGDIAPSQIDTAFWVTSPGAGYPFDVAFDEDTVAVDGQVVRNVDVAEIPEWCPTVPTAAE